MCDTLDQRTCRGRRKAEIPKLCRLLDTSYFSSNNPRNASHDIPEIPRRVRETDNGTWQASLKWESLLKKYDKTKFTYYV